MGQKLEFGILLINPMSPSAEAVCPVNLNYLTLGKPADSCSASPITPCAPLNPNPWGWAWKAPLLSKGYYGGQKGPSTQKQPCIRSSYCLSGTPSWFLEFDTCVSLCLPGTISPVAGFSFVIYSGRRWLASLTPPSTPPIVPSQVSFPPHY